MSAIGKNLQYTKIMALFVHKLHIIFDKNLESNTTQVKYFLDLLLLTTKNCQKKSLGSTVKAFKLNLMEAKTTDKEVNQHGDDLLISWYYNVIKLRFYVIQKYNPQMLSKVQHFTPQAHFTMSE